MASRTASTIGKAALVALTSTVALGCTTGTGIRVNYEPLAKISYPQTVPLLHEAPPADRKHIELGYITVSGDNTNTLDELRAAMRVRACEAGADAVYSLTRSDSSRELWIAGNPRDKQYVTSPTLSGLAVRFENAAARSPGVTPVPPAAAAAALPPAPPPAGAPAP